MSPILSREHYFLQVINELEQHRVEPGSLEEQLRDMLVELAESIRGKTPIDADALHRLNGLFEQYPAVRLKVSFVPQPVSLFADSNNDASEAERQVMLHTVFTDGPEQLKRMYMEAVISLVEAMEKGTLELQTCTQCNRWYIPYRRAQVTKFCSAACRNRYHYERGKTG
jgi:hypothetical protein